MRIAINVEIAFSHPTGMGRHARELLRHLMQVDRTNDYTLFFSCNYTWPPVPDLNGLPERVRVVRLPYSRRQISLAWLCWGGPRTLERLLGRHDVYHDLSNRLLPVTAERRIAALHDVSILRTPQAYAWHSQLMFRRALRELRRADAVITPSQHSRQQIVRRIGVSPERVHVVYNGVSSLFTPMQDAEGWSRTVAGVERPYLFFAGVLNRRKNIDGLVEVFARYLAETDDDELKLVLCGSPGIGDEDVRREVARRDLARRVLFLGYVDDTRLVALYRGAVALVFPSLDEGFGLPVIEAMAAGCPVICSDAASLPEVGADAALYVDPKDVVGWVSAIRRVRRDEDLRADLVRRGLLRAAEFSWRATALETLAVYENAA